MPGMKADVVVLSVNQYEVVDRETGEVNQGTTVRYALTDNLLPFQEDTTKGYKLAKARLGFNSFGEFKEVPAVYKADVRFNVGSDGTTKVVAENFVFQKSLFPVK